MRRAMILILAGLAASAAVAQDGEIIVTGSRADADYYSDEAPLIGLQRQADFAIQSAKITSDSREPQKRREEIFTMLKSALDLARQSGVELAFGDYLVEPLNAANYRDLPVSVDSRPDTSQVTFLVKVSLKGSNGKDVLDRTAAFMKRVPATGRAEMLPVGDLTLSVIGPESYRPKILELVAADAKNTATRFGDDYRVELRGADRPVEWNRASLTDVFLYIPYSYTIVPAGR